MIILDTNVISELMRPTPSAQVSDWIAQQPAAELFTTAITEAEILLGIEQLGPGKRRDGLLRAAERMFAEDFGGRILGFESDAAQAFAMIAAATRALGKPIHHADAQIAAITKLRHGKLATRNAKDFENCGIAVVNPWEST